MLSTLRRSGVALFIGMVVLLATHAAPATAAQSGVLTDAIGDVPKQAAVYQDIVKAQISKSGKTFTFTMDVAAPVPAVPPKTQGSLGWLVWDWGLDTDPSTFPVGTPFPTNVDEPMEFIVVVVWDGTQFQGLVIDRRPLLTGNPAQLVPISFSVNGTEITASVDGSVLGDPASFGWFASNENRNSWDSWGEQFWDFAPDSGFANWPS